MEGREPAESDGQDSRHIRWNSTAIETAISEGINVNVTLLFSQDVYEQVAHAYIRGLEKCADPSHVASVASFFVSRIDTAVEGYIKDNPALESLSGKVAIANAKLAYQKYLEIFSGPKWEALEARGAMTQRVLWASTSTKSAKMRDVVYVEELIGPGHRRYDSSGYARCVPRSRRSARVFGIGNRRSQRRDGAACGGRRFDRQDHLGLGDPRR